MSNGFIIYSKSGCADCVKVKQFLNERCTTFNEIDCDDELIENRLVFLTSIQELTGGQKVTMFPIVFYNGEYLGGYKETVDFTIALLRELHFCATEF